MESGGYGKQYFLLISIIACLIFFIACEKAQDSQEDFTIKIGGIWGRVTNTKGVPLKGVAVFINNPASEEADETEQITTDESGVFLVTPVAENERVVLRFEKEGHVTQFYSVPVFADVVSDAQVVMIEQGNSILFDSEDYVDVELEKVKVTLPPDSLVDNEGASVSGNALLSVTYYDGSTDDIDAAPGDFVCHYINGDVEANGLIGSVGMLALEFSQEGQKLQLAEGTAFEVEVMLGDNSEFGFTDDIPAWQYDGQSGKWIKAGECEVELQEDRCSMTVDSAGIWNLADLYESVCYTGKVFGNEDRKIGGVEIVAQGLDFVGRSVAHTAKDGAYEIYIRANSNVTLFFKKEFDFFQMALKTIKMSDASEVCETLDTLTVPGFKEQNEDDGFDFFGQGQDDPDDEDDMAKSACCGL